MLDNDSRPRLRLTASIMSAPELCHRRTMSGRSDGGCCPSASTTITRRPGRAPALRKALTLCRSCGSGGEHGPRDSFSLRLLSRARYRQVNHRQQARVRRANCIGLRAADCYQNSWQMSGFAKNGHNNRKEWLAALNVRCLGRFHKQRQ